MVPPNLALLAFPVYCVILSQLMPLRRALLTAVISGWLFLPHAKMPVPGLPDFDREMAIAVAVAIMAVAFGFGRYKLPRLRAVDLFVVVLSFTPFVTALTNNMGAWEGMSYSFTNALRFLVPYAAGRIYFADSEGALQLTKAIYIGGLIYIPLILIEKVISPQLHSHLYGFMHFSFAQTLRSGGYRPVVFMQHGLATALWMAAAALSGVILKRAGLLKSMGFWGSWWMVGLLCFSLVACVSAGALALMVLCLGAYTVYRNVRSPWLIICIALIPSFYVLTRSTGAVPTAAVTDLGALVFNDARVESLRTRLENEDVLAEKAWEQPVFGWGRFGNNRVREDGKDAVITDGFWIIVFGQLGLVGIISMLGMYFFAVSSALVRSSNRLLARPEGAAVIALCLIATMHMIDNLFNAMVNPIFIVALGAVAGHLGLSSKLANREAEREAAIELERADEAKRLPESLPSPRPA